MLMNLQDLVALARATSEAEAAALAVAQAERQGAATRAGLEAVLGVQVPASAYAPDGIIRLPGGLELRGDGDGGLESHRHCAVCGADEYGWWAVCSLSALGDHLQSWTCVRCQSVAGQTPAERLLAGLAAYLDARDSEASGNKEATA